MAGTTAVFESSDTLLDPDAWWPWVDDLQVGKLLTSMSPLAYRWLLGAVKYLESHAEHEIALRLGLSENRTPGVWLVEPQDGWTENAMVCLLPPPAVLILGDWSRYTLGVFYGDRPESRIQWTLRYMLNVSSDERRVVLQVARSDPNFQEPLVLANARADDWFRYIVWRESMPR
jgi:hypothetical protein